jgi:hypothetical protein
LLERHEAIYANERKDLGELIAFVKETIRPMPLSSGISDFRITKTGIAVEPMLQPEPVKSKSCIVALFVLMVTGFIGILVAFYIEGREK